MTSSLVRAAGSSSKSGPERLTFQIKEGLVLTADAYGDPANRPVLLAHGGGQTRHAWGGTARTLAEHGCYAVSLDLRGHGDSDWSPAGDYQIDYFADDVRQVAAELGRPVMVGASLGGLSAMVAGGEEPKADFAAVVLVDIAPHIEIKGSERVLDFMRDKLDEGFATLEEAADAVAAYLPERPRPTDLKGLEKNLRRRDDGRWRWHWDPKFVSGDRKVDGARKPDRLAAAVKNITCPMLLVRGRMSDVISENSVRKFLELQPTARFVDIARAGHMVAGDANDVFTEAVTTFLDELR
ncbi:MAG: alpha/beta hydrolase fold [Alphaproteobacteria bacterium]|jgi:pimeloyl-ACP methyl ester carboxylesterase|nr:alpha/beta hydrolase fold [Alphaproteobacteria bacterium]